MNSENNEAVTIDRNADLCRCKTRKQQGFHDRALRINLEEQREFTYQDFPDYSKGNFRQMILKLKDKIELVVRSPQGFYKVRGVYLPGDRRRITYDGMGVGMNMIPMLRSLRQQPPAVHGFKAKFHCNIHRVLRSEGFDLDPSNNGIFLSAKFENIAVKIQVYPETVQIDLACTYKPFVYDIGGVINLVTYLGRIYQHLVYLSSNKVDIPLPAQWTVTHYHFGKDGTEALSGPRFERKFEDLAGGLIRFYAKEMRDGKVIPRIEKIVTPNQSLNREIDSMIQEELDLKTEEEFDSKIQEEIDAYENSEPWLDH